MKSEEQAARLGSTAPDQETELDSVHRVSIDISERVSSIHARLNDLLDRLGTPIEATTAPNIQEVPDPAAGHLGRINHTSRATLGTLDEISVQLNQVERFA